MFEAYIENISVDTYDYAMVTIDDSIFNPIKEYLFHLPCGFLGASLISQTLNPHIIQHYQHSFLQQKRLTNIAMSRRLNFLSLFQQISLSNPFHWLIFRHPRF